MIEQGELDQRSYCATAFPNAGIPGSMSYVSDSCSCGRPGCAGTDAPPEIERCTLLHMVDDMMGLVDGLGIAQAVKRLRCPGGVARSPVAP